MMQKINKFAAGQTRSILINTSSNRSHEFYREFYEHLFCITYNNHMQNRCSKKSHKTHGIAPVLESLFSDFIKKTPFPENSGKFLRTPF